MGVRHSHCSRCGTHRMETFVEGKIVHTSDTVPSLVFRCLKFSNEIVRVCDDDSLLMHWHQYGIEEATRLPADRQSGPASTQGDSA